MKKFYLTNSVVSPCKKRFSVLHLFLKRICTFSLFLFFFVSVAMSQSKRVTGKVTDSDNGQALPGVTVTVEGTSVAAVSDNSGQYIIETSDSKATLLFSSVGFASQKIKIGNRSVIDVSLISDFNELEQVVVVGYGTVIKRNATGAISSVKAKDLSMSASTNFTQAIAGKVPGLVAIQSSGQPGADVSVQIRSTPSFASSGVLYVIDGVPSNDNANDPGTNTRYGSNGINRSPLNFLNPNDIESIEVLKDASAASIYGARAGAGVILITTKRGKGDKVRLNYDVSYAYQKASKFYDILNTKDYMDQRNEIRKEMWMRSNNIAPYGNVDPSTAPAFVPKYTQQEISSAIPRESAVQAITRKGFTPQHNLSLSGGSAKTKYYISGNYLNQSGVIRGTDYVRYGGKINFDHALSSRIKLGVNLTTSNDEAGNGIIGTGQNENSGIILSAFYYPANLPFKDSNGNYLLNPDYSNSPNPLSFLEVTDKSKGGRMLTNGFAEWEIIEGLKAKANFSFDQSSQKRSVYQPKSFLYGARGGGVASINESNSNTNLMEYTLNYTRDFKKDHDINILAGYSYQVSNREGFGAANNKFLSDNFLYNNLASGESAKPIVSSYKGQLAWASYFGRFMYNYKNRYLVNASVRRDGATIFAKNNKFGVFPSVSVGWILSDESFLEDRIKFIDFLKVRAGYGTTGNSGIGSSAFAYYRTGTNYVFGNSQIVGVVLSQLNNDNLTWETVGELNIGLDFRLFKGRINGSVDYFNKDISNLLNFRPLTSDFPVRQIADNIGKTQSKGWEIGLQSYNIVSASKKSFEWNTSLTLSHYKNKWIERSPEVLQNLDKYIDPKGSFDAIYGYVSQGIYRGGAAPAWMPGIIPGTVIIKDQNGYNADGNLTGKPDGKISSADRVQIGTAGPKYSYGITNTFKYKNVDLSVNMYGYIQQKYNHDFRLAFEVERQMAGYGWNTLDIIKERWSYKNPNAKYPTGLTTSYHSYSDDSNFWLENANFLRIRDITVGYSLPTELLGRQKVISNLRVYMNILNAFVITKYNGMDPELQNLLAYPNTRSIVVGLNVGF